MDKSLFLGAFVSVMDSNDFPLNLTSFKIYMTLNM